jgi:diadenylate cyclase
MNSNYPLAGYGFENATGICSFIFGILFLIGIDFCLFKFIKNIYAWVIVIVLEAIITITSGFGMVYFELAVLIALISFISVLLVINQHEIKNLLNDPTLKNKIINVFKSKKKKEAEKLALVNDDSLDRVLDEVYKAVIYCSRAKYGALITFERKEDILDPHKKDAVWTQTGIKLNSEVTAELLETIFYKPTNKGNPLHDGAAVIRGDKVINAAVYFVTTKRNLPGTIGARHQAAIGISENSDSITVVVSEQSGAIEIAIRGKLIQVDSTNFLPILKNYMTYGQIEQPFFDKYRQAKNRRDY